MKQWYYDKAGQPTGPLTESEITKLIEANEVLPNTLLWAQGMNEWTPVSKIPQFTLSPYAPPSTLNLTEMPWSNYTPTGPQIRPWVRYWARTCDYYLVAIVVGIVVGLASPSLLLRSNYFIGALSLAASLIIEPIMFYFWGTTPFKALFKIRVRNPNGTCLTYLQALRRSANVLIRGKGLGIPIASLITHMTSYSRLSQHGITSWDATGKFVVSHQEIEWWRWVIFSIIFVSIVALIALGWSTVLA